MAGIVEYFPSDESGSRCGYCKGADTSYSKGMWAYFLGSENYQDLIDRGWRRSGRYCYKPTLERTCCPQYTIRCYATRFKPSRSHKKILKRMHKFLLNGKSEDKSDDNGTEGGCVGDAEEEVEDAMDCPPDMTSMGEGRSQPQIDCDITDNRLPLPEDLPTPTNCRVSGSDGGIPVVRERSSSGNEKIICGKKKELRRAKWLEKRLANNQPVEAPTPKNPEKSLEEWLQLPEGKHKLRVRLVQSHPESGEFLCSETASHIVYTKYQTSVHGDTEEKCKMKQWKQFLVDSPIKRQPGSILGSYHHQYWLDDKLIAVGVLDVLPYCISSVYFYYDPEYSFLSLGTFASLNEIKLTRELHRTLPSLKYYYMGFYIHSCPKMRYKGKLCNSDLLCPEAFTWHPIENCVPLLDSKKYSRLEPDEKLGDPNRPSSVSMASVVYGDKGLTMTQYLACRKVDRSELECIREYSDLVGDKCMKEIYLLRH